MAGTTPSRIFLCYRRDDSSGHTGRIYDELSHHFAPGQVFMDIDSIDPGLDFTEVVDRALASSAVVVVVIGRGWLTAADERGRRLDDPGDHVRRELATALARGRRVIPVLVQGARMPTVGQLPEPLQPLAHRNAIELSDTRWRFDIDNLTRALDRTVAHVGGGAGTRVIPRAVEAGAPVERPHPPQFTVAATPVPHKRRSYLLLAAAAFALLAGVLAWNWVSDLSHAVGVPTPLAELVVSSHSYPVRSMLVCSDGIFPGIVVEVILDGQTSEVPIVTWSGVTAKGKTIYPGTPLLLKVSNGLNCPRS